MLRKMGLKLERLEQAIFDEEANREIVRDLSNAKQEIINFRKIVRPQRAALKDLERTKRYVTGELDIYFDDINDASERIWDMLENFKEVDRGPRGDERVGPVAQPERHPPRADGVQRDHAAADADRVGHGHERRRAGRAARSTPSGSCSA